MSFDVLGGTGTLRLVWGDSDTTGSPCPKDPEAWADWEIRYGGLPQRQTIYGSDTCNNSTAPSWSGVNDIVVTVSLTPYYVDIWWWDSYWGNYEIASYPNVMVTAHGEVVTWHY